MGIPWCQAHHQSREDPQPMSAGWSMTVNYGNRLRRSCCRQVRGEGGLSLTKQGELLEPRLGRFDGG